MSEIFRREMLTEIEISATADRVWGVLTDFGSYCEWNPMIIRAGGELRTGVRLKVRFQPKGSKGRTFRPRLLVVEPDRELRWLGWPRFPFFFDSEHYFTIERSHNGKTRLKHGLVEYGLVTPLVAGGMEKSSRGHFKKMNEALKERAELNSGGS